MKVKRDVISAPDVIPAAFVSDFERGSAVAAAIRHVAPRRTDNDALEKNLRAVRRLSWQTWRDGGGVTLARQQTVALRGQAVEMHDLAGRLEQRNPGQARESETAAANAERRAGELDALVAAAGDVVDVPALAQRAAEAEHAIVGPRAALERHAQARIAPPADLVQRYQAAVEAATRARTAHQSAIHALDPVRRGLREAEDSARQALARVLVDELGERGRAIADFVAANPTLSLLPELDSPAARQLDALCREGQRVVGLVEQLDFDGAAAFETPMGKAARVILRARGNRLAATIAGENDPWTFRRAGFDGLTGESLMEELTRP